MAWEDVLGSFADSSQSTYSRTSVMDPTASWIDTYYVGLQANAPDLDFQYTITWPTNPPIVGVIGCTANLANITGSAAPVQQFTMQGDRILNPLVHSPYQNGVTSVWSFDNASAAVAGVDSWLSGWQGAINSWADEVNAPDSDWQGSAAGVFKGLLNGVAGQLETLRTTMRTSDVTAQLDNTRQQLISTLVNIYNIYTTWRATPHADPVIALNDQFGLMAPQVNGTIYTMGGSGGTDVPPLNSPWGDPRTEAFWNTMGAEAKNLWSGNVVSNLDTPSAPLITQLEANYQQVAATVSAGVSLPGLRTPPATDPGSSVNGDPNAKTDDLLKNLLSNPNGNGQGTGTDPTGNGATPFGVKNSSPAGAGFSTLSGPAAGGNSLSNPSYKSLTGVPGGDQQLLDANGKPVLDNGKPVSAPPGSYIGAGGVVMTPAGVPFEPNGHKIVAPKGATLSGTTLNSDPLLTVPKGAKINPDGTVVDAEGNPVMVNGSPMVVPKGSTISGKGVIEGPNGQALTESTARQLSEGSFLPNLSSPDLKLTSPNGVNDLFPGGAKLAGGLDTAGGFGTGPGGSNGLLPIKGPMAVSERAAEAAGIPADEMIQRVPTMSEAMPAEAALGRPGTSSEQPPFMPPMGGAGGGGGGGGQERRPNTWLTEDEKVWGTENSGASGVIGR